MKNYFTIAILGLFFCNSALALSFGAPPVIPISKPQKKSTSTPSTTKKQQSSTKKTNVSPTKNTTSKATSKSQKPTTNTKKQQSSTKKTNVSPTKNTTPNATSKPPEPTTEENLSKVSDGLDAAIDMVKKICNKDGANNTISSNNRSQEKKITQYNNKNHPNYDPAKELSVSEADLLKLASNMEKNFSDEADSHFGRNVASLKPYSLNEMIYELNNGNPNGYGIFVWDEYHQENGKNTFWSVNQGNMVTITDPSEQISALNEMREEGIKNVKFVNTQGAEVVYDLKTGEIDKSGKMGTSNKGETGLFSTVFGNHKKVDINPHKTTAIPGNPYTRDGDQYKYVGILYERDKNVPNKFYIRDGQTGKRMSAEQAYKFAATISDMWVGENHQQCVIDPLDSQYKEHLEYYDKNRIYTEEEIQQGLERFSKQKMSQLPTSNNQKCSNMVFGN